MIVGQQLSPPGSGATWIAERHGACQWRMTAHDLDAEWLTVVDALAETGPRLIETQGALRAVPANATAPEHRQTSPYHALSNRLAVATPQTTAECAFWLTGN